MLKVIFCFNCATKTDTALRKVATAQGKYYSCKLGTAQRQYLCDNCDAEIPIGENCAAISQADSENHRTNWEVDYINLLQP